MVARIRHRLLLLGALAAAAIALVSASYVHPGQAATQQQPLAEMETRAQSDKISQHKPSHSRDWPAPRPNAHPAAAAHPAHAVDVLAVVKEPAPNLELRAVLEQQVGSVPPGVEALLRMQAEGETPDALQRFAVQHLPRDLRVRVAVLRWLSSLRGEAPHEPKLMPARAKGRNLIGTFEAR